MCTGSHLCIANVPPIRLRKWHRWRWRASHTSDLTSQLTAAPMHMQDLADAYLIQQGWPTITTAKMTLNSLKSQKRAADILNSPVLSQVWCICVQKGLPRMSATGHLAPCNLWRCHEYFAIVKRVRRARICCLFQPMMHAANVAGDPG